MSFSASQPVADLATVWGCAAASPQRDRSTSPVRSAAQYLVFTHAQTASSNTTEAEIEKKAGG